MRRVAIRRKLFSFASLLPTCATTLLSTVTAEAQIQVNIVEPALNATSSGSLYVRATVSSVFEVSSVIAQVEGRSVNLIYSQPLSAWTNALPLTGLSFGAHTLAVTAQEFFGGTAQAGRTFRVDNSPTLTVHEPINGTVVNGKVFISAEATDDGGETVIKAYFPTTPQRTPAVIATNRVQGFFSVAAFSGGNQVTFEAIDSGGNKRSIGRKIVLEPSSNLTETAQAPGSIFDFDSARFLYSVEADINFTPNPTFPAPWPYGRPEPRILARQSGQVTSSRSLFESWIEGSLDTTQPSFIDSGLLGDTGCLLWSGNLFPNIEPMIFGWNGSEANYSLINLSTVTFGGTASFKVVGNTTIGVRRFNGSEGPKLVLQDINTSNLLYEIAFPLQTSIQGDLAPNYDLVYTVSNHVFRNRPISVGEPYSNRHTTQLTTGTGGATGGVITDGTNVVYARGSDVVLIAPSGEELLASPGNGPFKTINGWVAYTKPGTSGQTQIWTRSPAGTLQQRTFFSASSTLESVGPNGEVTFLFSNARYVSLPGVQQPVWVNSGQGRVRWNDGKLIVILGRSVLEFRMGRLLCAKLADGKSQLTFAGPNGFSYAVQGSTDLKTWTDLWTFAHTTGSISWTNVTASTQNFYRAVTISSP